MKTEVHSNIMTTEKIKSIIETEVPFDKLEKDQGIYEFHDDGNFSIGVSYESEGPHGENMERYIYNLFFQGKYINISGYGTKEELIPEDVLHEMVEKWNRLAAPEKVKEISHEETKALMDLVSKGLDAGLIELSVRDNEMSAQIGDYGFCFDDSYVEDGFSFDSIPREELIQKIVGAMVDIKNDLSEDESLYFKAVLEEGLEKKNAKTYEIRRMDMENFQEYNIWKHANENMAKTEMKKCIKKWYQNAYPTDELGEELNEKVTFDRLYDEMRTGKDVYVVLGSGVDSIVRERVFTELSELLGVSYDAIYDLWLSGDKGSVDVGNGKKPKIEVLIRNGENVVAQQKNEKGVKEKGNERLELLGDSLKWR